MRRALTNRCNLVLALVGTLIAGCIAGPSTNRSIDESAAGGYLPTMGDRVVMATHRFRQEDFAAGKKAALAEFSNANDSFGQARRTYFLDNADEHVVVEVSFSHSASDPDTWIRSDSRNEADVVVAPFYREPVDLFHLTVAQVHDTPATASYLPRAGDRAIIFTHRFTEEGYEEGKRVVTEGFSKAIDKSGQTRRTYFTDDRETRTVIVFSFFHADSTTDDWLSHSERHKVLSTLEPLRRAPLEVYHVTVEDIHDAQRKGTKSVNK